MSIRLLRRCSLLAAAGAVLAVLGAALPDTAAAAGLTATWPLPAPSCRPRGLACRPRAAKRPFGDLVGLAWTAQRHPALYTAWHAWLMAERTADLLAGSHHDTLQWLQLVAAGMPAVPGPAGALFSGPAVLWQQGLEAAAAQASRPDAD